MDVKFGLYAINDELGLCEFGRVASNKFGLYAINDDCGLRVASFNLKVGLRTVITKIGKLGPYATATQLKFGMFGSCTITASSKFGPNIACAKFGLYGLGSMASTSFSGVASLNKLNRVASSKFAASFDDYGL